jgi:hypothetical protein
MRSFVFGNYSHLEGVGEKMMENLFIVKKMFWI